MGLTNQAPVKLPEVQDSQVSAQQHLTLYYRELHAHGFRAEATYIRHMASPVYRMNTMRYTLFILLNLSYSQVFFPCYDTARV